MEELMQSVRRADPALQLAAVSRGDCVAEWGATVLTTARGTHREGGHR